MAMQIAMVEKVKAELTRVNKLACLQQNQISIRRKQN